MEERYLSATTKNVPESAQKVRLVARLMKGMKAVDALQMLELENHKASRFLKNTVKSALANATVKGLAAGTLRIGIIKINDAPSGRGLITASKGRGYYTHKRKSHIYIKLIAE